MAIMIALHNSQSALSQSKSEQTASSAVQSPAWATAIGKTQSMAHSFIIFGGGVVVRARSSYTCTIPACTIPVVQHHYSQALV